MYHSTAGLGTSPTVTSTLSSSPDPLASFFNTPGAHGVGAGGEWDWSNNLIELPPPSPTHSLSPDTPAMSPVGPALSPTSAHSPISPALSPTSAIEPPSQPSPDSANSTTTRKRRKREINLSPEMYNIGFEWSHYNSPSATFQIYDTNSLQLITHQFDIVTHKVESNTHFSAVDNAWICYRQNQFKVVSFLKCPQPQPAMSISDSGVLKEIHQLCVRLYAIKELSTLVADEVRVGIHHVGRARVKKEKQEISMTPFVNGRAEFANVQFEKSNSVKGQQLEYFRLVMAFYAKAGNSYFHIFSKQSPKLIVRSQNPGFYGDITYNYYGSMGIVPAGVVPDASIHKTGRVGGVTGGAGIPMVPSGNVGEGMGGVGGSGVNGSGMGGSGMNGGGMNGSGIGAVGGSGMNGAMGGNGVGGSGMDGSGMGGSGMGGNGVGASEMGGDVIGGIGAGGVNGMGVNGGVGGVVGIGGVGAGGMGGAMGGIAGVGGSIRTSGGVGGGIAGVGGVGGVGPARVSGIKRGTEGEDYSDASYQVPNMNTNPNFGPITTSSENMNFDTASNESSETDYLLSSNGWQMRGDSMVFKGNVGINVTSPSEALTVRGNVLVHGDVYKPSDRRIKSDITPVNPSEQLGTIRELKIYDYTVNSKKERGVLAQELQVVMPNAVRPVGDVVVGSKVISNFLTVNERSLLFENIGATQQLDKEVEHGRKSIMDINTKVEDLKFTTHRQNANMQGTVHTMYALFFQEEDKKGTHNGLEEEYVSFGFSLFRMGPARTFLVLGHFIPWIWAIGACYLFSNLIRRRILGAICMFLFGIFMALMVMDYLETFPRIDIILLRCRIAWVGIGLLLLFINYIRLRRKLASTAKKPGGAKLV